MIERLTVHLSKQFGQALTSKAGSAATSVEIMTIAAAPAAKTASEDDRTEDVGFLLLAPVSLENRHMLWRGNMTHDVLLDLIHQSWNAFTVTNVKDDPKESKLQNEDKS